jgi:putative membrane protein
MGQDLLGKGMKTLVLCVDRDNDLGEKTGLGSPVIGREECLKAATELGIKDPAETDTNAIFMAVKLLDTLIKEEKDAEMAIVTGHKYLGEKADRTIADQLDEVLDTVKPNRAILVSDGVSDEAIMPVLQSRVKIDHVHRFEHWFTKYKVLKWEEKIYALMRYMGHDAIRIGVGLPITLLMIFYGSFTLTGFFGTPMNPPAGMILVGLGVYFLAVALRLRERFRAYIKTVRKDIRTASVTPIFALVAMLLVFTGMFFSYNMVDEQTGWSAAWEAYLLFAISIIWWVVAAILLRLGGGVLDRYLRFKKVRMSFVHDAMQTIAFGFIIYGLLIGLNFFLVEYAPEVDFTPVLIEIVVYIFIGVITGVVSALVYRSIQSKLRKKTKVKSA